MNLSAEKIRLSQFILTTENKELLHKIKNLIETDAHDIWDELHEDIKADVEFSIKEFDNGGGIPNEIVMEKYQKWLKK